MRPDNSRLTCTCGGTMSGNCATGIALQGEDAGEADHDRDDQRQARPMNKDRRDHSPCLSVVSRSVRRRFAASPSCPRDALLPLDDDALAGFASLLHPAEAVAAPSRADAALFDDVVWRRRQRRTTLSGRWRPPLVGSRRISGRPSPDDDAEPSARVTMSSLGLGRPLGRFARRSAD